MKSSPHFRIPVRLWSGLSERDRRAVAALVLFLGAVGYALYLFDPLYRDWQQSRESLVERRAERDRIRRQARERDSWLADREWLEARVGRLGAALPGAALEAAHERPPAEIVGDIVDAAAAAGVEVDRITPQPATAQEGASYAIEGVGSIDGVGALLSELWGLRVSELTLALGGDGYGLDFSLRVAPIDAAQIARVARSGEGHAPVEFVALPDDPFAPRPPPAPVEAYAAPVEVAEPEPTLDLIGLQLAGVVDLAEGYVAAVYDAYEAASRFVSPGDEVRGYLVAEVTAEQIVLKHEGLRGALRLPERADPVERLDDIPGVPPTDFSDRVTWEATDPGGVAAVDPELLERAGARLGVRLVALADGQPASGASEGGATLFVSDVLRPDTLIAVGDLIATVDGIAVERLAAVLETLAAATPGQQLRLEIVRAGKIGPLLVTAEGGTP